MLAARICQEDAQTSGARNDQYVFPFWGRHFSEAPGTIQKVFQIGNPDDPRFCEGGAVYPVVSCQSPRVGEGRPFP